MKDTMEKANEYLFCEIGNRVTPRFISGIAHMLNSEEPFDVMTSGEILKYFKNSLFPTDDRGNETFKNRLHAAKLIRQVSKERYGRDFERKDSLPLDSALHKYLPKKVRLEASTICQLRCAGCGFQKGGEDDLDRGYLTFGNFKHFCDMNPFIEEIELSNWGEIFLNPDLVKIMYEAKDRNIKLTAWNGSNFNTVSDEQMQAMVDTGFAILSLSIDGASQETYSKYRIGGDYNKVIENVKKLQKYKEKADTKLPRLQWQYVLMEYNELEIGKAKKIAKELGIKINFKYNWDEKYKPVNREYIMRETGLTELTRAEYVAANGVPPYDIICRNFILKPQINWDGRLLGCCDQKYACFDVNVFEVGLEAAMKSTKYIQAKECLLSVHPDREKYGSCICFNCKRRIQREKADVALEL